MTHNVSVEFQTAGGKARHPLPLERVIETRPDARAGLKNFLIDCNKLFNDFNFEIGPDKDLEVAENKANRDYAGDQCRVTDFVRAKGNVTSPETVRQLQGREFEHLLHEHGIHIAEMNDYFSDPKDQTGYSCLNHKLAVPVGTDETGNTEYHIVELQVVAEQIEAVYDQTHIYKRRAEEAENKVHELMETHNIYPLKMKDLNGNSLSEEEKKTLKDFDTMIKPLKRIAKLNYGACRLLNGRARRGDAPENNFENLLADDKKSKHFLYPGREEHLESMMFKADRLARETENYDNE